MRTFIAFLLIAICICGCETPYHTYPYYFSGGGPVSHVDRNLFSLSVPKTWVVYGDTPLDESGTAPGIEICIPRYEWSPTIFFNFLTNNATWETDLPRMGADLTRRARLRDITV